jgi:hypothetical protein
MENLGYKEGSAKPKTSLTGALPPAGLTNVVTKRRMSRARPSIVEAEALPLSISPRYENKTSITSHVIFN